ncbi:patatin-like phospholipase family protein [Brachybacterium hainanense]|uniref:Patatin-like phospholipase family protein n=1 Tax=Brachybacterium hainanense TaxID=1541174 RepID=A0ABV6REE9_9MICO
MHTAPPSSSSDVFSAPAPAPDVRALVLGGGGSTGNAWLIGVLAGLAEGGADVSAPELTIGTSAGATAAAQLIGRSPAELYQAVLETPPMHGTAAPSASSAPRSPATPPGPAGAASALARITGIITDSADLPDFRRRIGADALARGEQAGPQHSRRWRGIVAARLSTAEWPQRRVVLTAVDARTGEEVLLDRDSGVDLVDAVAASCASGPAYRLGGRRLIDGGFRIGAENADLASGCGRVLVLSPLGGRSLHPRTWGTLLEDRVGTLCAQGSQVRVLVPDVAHDHLFGANAMNAALRPEAARVGRDQGLLNAPQVAELWRC